MQNNEFNEFDELIREIVQQEIQNYMKNEMIFRGITGQVTKVNDDGTCSVDTITTVVNNIENKSGSKLQVGDSVTLSERIGSDYSNCFINVKNGHQDPGPTTKEIVKETINNIYMIKTAKITEADDYRNENNFIRYYIIINGYKMTEEENPTFFDDVSWTWDSVTSYKNKTILISIKNEDYKTSKMVYNLS